MYVGVSKSLGSGFRIGAAVPLGSSGSRTAAAKANRDADFVRGCQARIGHAFWEYALSHGVCVAYKDMEKSAQYLQTHDLTEIDTAMDRFTECLNLYRDTTKISQGQKERMLKAVYAIESFLSSKHGSPDLTNAITVISKAGSADIWLWGFSALMLFGFPVGTFLIAPISGFIAYRMGKKLKPARDEAKARVAQMTTHAISNPLKVALDLKRSR